MDAGEIIVVMVVGETTTGERSYRFNLQSGSIFYFRRQAGLGSKPFLSKLFEKLRQRLPPMADTIFLLHRKFRRCFSEIRYKKVRIVAKPSFTARLQGDFAVPASGGDNGFRIICTAQKYDNAVIMRFAVA